MNKRNGIIIILLSIVFILFGAVLLFINKSEDTKEKTVNEDKILSFTKMDVRSCLYEKVVSSGSEIINVVDTSIVAHNSNNSKYLVRYLILMDDGSTKEYESIANAVNKREIEYPGWEVGSKKIEEYNFIYYNNNENGSDFNH